MKPWTRWQEWTMAVIGVLVVLSPLVVANTSQSTITVIVLGAAVALVSLFALVQPQQIGVTEWVTLVLGVLLFIAPWVMGYSDGITAAWVSWIGGAVTVIISALGLPSAISRQRLTTH